MSSVVVGLSEALDNEALIEKGAKLKETEETGLIPIWDLKDAKDILYIKGRIGWKGLKKSEFTDSGPYLITGIHFLNNKIDWKNCYHISMERYVESPEIQIKENDVLLTKDGTIGKVAYIDRLPGLAALNSHILLLRPIDDSLIQKFFYYILQSKSFDTFVMSVKSGSTFSGISQSNFGRFRIPIPPLSEQHKIAAILSSVDAAIEQTDAIIAQTERMKKGLMQYVFITEAAKKNWEITNLSKLAQIEMGQSPPGSTYNEIGDGMPLINGPTEFGRSYPKPIQWTTSPTKICKEDDILFCVRGSSTGRMNSADREYCIGRGVAAIRGKPNKGNTLFIKHYLVYEVPRIYMLAAGGGSTFPNITSTLLNAYPCCLPSLSEQRKIATVFLSIDQKLEFENQYQNNLRLIQRGLMQDLLIGRVRVKVDGHA
jgi:type I restriction enzyme S subunit